MAEQTVEELQIIINAKVDAQVKQIGTMLAVQFKAAEAAMQPLQQKVQALSTAMSKIGQSVGEPMQKSFRQVQAEINKAQAKTNDYSSKVVQQMNAQAAKEEAVQQKRAEVAQQTTDRIVQSYQDIESAVARTMEKMQTQAQGGVYAQKSLPLIGAKTSTQILSGQTTPIAAISTAQTAWIDNYKTKLAAVGVAASGAFAKVSDSIKKTKDSTDKATVSTQKYGNTVKKALSAVADVFSKISSIIGKLGGVVISFFKKFGNAAKNSAQKATSSFSKLGETIKRVLILGVLYKGFRELFSFISNGIKAAISAPEIENMFNIAFGSAAAAADEFAGKLKSAFGIDKMASKQMLATFQNFNISMGLGSQTAAKMSKSLTQLTYDMASLYEADPQQVFENLQSGLQGMPRALYKYGISVTEANVKQTALTHGIIQQGEEMNEQQKIIARYITILNQTGTSQGDLARTMQSPANQLRIFKSQMEAAGRAIGQAFMPFIQAVLPWINALAVVLERAGNALARFTFRLFGRDFDAEMKAKKDALSGLQDSIGGITGGMDEAGNAAEEAGKKAKGALAPFDKLNVIKNQSADIGGTGAGGGYDFAVPEMPEPTGQSPFKKMADQIVDFFKKHSFAEIGKIIAQKLNEAIASVDWYGIGAKLGYWFQQILELAYNFLVSFDWMKFGTSIANSIMGFINAIDWHLFGSIIAEHFNSIFEFVYGVVTGLDWNKIGLSISNAFNGFFDSVDLNLMASTIADLFNGIVIMMQNAIANTDWKAAAVKIGEAINKFFTDIDWEKLGTTISDFVIALIEFLNELITTVDWAKVGESIGAMLGAIDWYTIVSNLYVLIGKALVGALNIIGGVIKGAVNTYFTKEIEAVGGNVIEGLKNGLEKAIAVVNPIGMLLSKLINPMIDAVKKALGINSPSTVFAEIGNFMIDGLINGILGMVEKTKETVINVCNIIKERFQEGLNKIIGFVQGVFSTDWNSAWNNISSKFSEIWGNMENGVSKAVNGIKGFVDNMIGWVQKGIDSLLEFIGIKEKSESGGRSYNAEYSGGSYSSRSLSPYTRSMPVPALAQGAVLRRSTLVNVAEYAGAASNPEIVSPQSIMYETVVQANAQTATQLTRKLDQVIQAIGRIDPTFVIGDDIVYRSTIRGGEEQRRMTNSPAFNI